VATKNISIRIPDELHVLVKASADADHRSLNSQIIWLLEAGLASREPRPRDH
jgi:predicted HicB family RNase H-like nuclease